MNLQTSTPVCFLLDADNTFALQLHVTEECNLRCKHCYSEDWNKHISFDKFKDIIAQLQEILEMSKLRGIVYLTGGEPMQWPYIYKSIKYLVKHRIKPRLLTNGTLIDDKTALKLREHGLTLAQVSLDGMQNTHDNIRGKGQFERAIRGINALLSAGIEVTIMVTVMQENFDEIDQLADLADDLKVHRINFGRFIPIGNKMGLNELTAQQTRELYEFLHEKEISVDIVHKDPFDAIIKKENEEHNCNSYGGCSAGQFLLDLLTNGDVLACRRLPVAVDNIANNKLLDIWLFNPLLKKIRKRTSISECNDCDLILQCGGGCRGMAFVINNDMFTKDPQCFSEGQKIRNFIKLM